MRRIHIEVEQQRKLFEGGMRQQLGLVADENRVLLLRLVETHDGFRDLAHQVAPVVRRDQVQFQRELPQQVESRSAGPVQIQDLIEIGIEAGGKGARRGGFAGAYFSGEQTGAVMIHQELKPRLHLGPGLRGKQLLGIRAVAEGRFLEAEEGLYHGRESSSLSSFWSWSNSTKLMPVGSGEADGTGFGEGIWPLTTGSTSRATPCDLPWK